MFKSNSVYLIYLRHSEIGPYVLYGSRGANEVTKQSLPEIMMLRQALENERPSHCAD